LTPHIFLTRRLPLSIKTRFKIKVSKLYKFNEF
jgi:hypothetical protein